jgi:cytochrome bd ubiquinol oxidase subunit I
VVDFRAFVLSPWALVQYAHTMVAAVVTGAFVVAAVGAYYALAGRHLPTARLFLRLGVAMGLVASLLVAVTGDRQAKLVAAHQPVTLAAMEGHFETSTHVGLVIIGQPNVAERRLDNPVVIPWVLSFLAYGTFHAAGIGTILTAIALLAALLIWRGRLEGNRPVLWVLMLAFPLPYIANTVGWMTAELGRQPWIGGGDSIRTGAALRGPLRNIPRRARLRGPSPRSNGGCSDALLARCRAARAAQTVCAI